jgi:hypothetical protein
LVGNVEALVVNVSVRVEERVLTFAVVTIHSRTRLLAVVFGRIDFVVYVYELLLYFLLILKRLFLHLWYIHALIFETLEYFIKYVFGTFSILVKSWTSHWIILATL